MPGFETKSAPSELKHETAAPKSEDRANAALFLLRVEQCIHPKTDPAIINRILKELHLDALKSNDPKFVEFIENLKINPVDMKAFLEKLKADLLNNKSLCTLFADIQRLQLISDKELKAIAPILQLQMNLLCITEAMTLTMLNSNVFLNDIHKHILERRGGVSTGNPWANLVFGTPASASMFERLKIISVDPGILNILFNRLAGECNPTAEVASEFIKTHKLSSFNAELNMQPLGVKDESTVAGMGLNILEAAWCESKASDSSSNGKIANAKSCLALIAAMEYKGYQSQTTLNRTVMPCGIPVDGNSYALLPSLKVDATKKRVSEFLVDKDWQDLYNSWNCRFVIDNIDNAFLPLKLLIPSVLGAESRFFKEARIVSLFLFANLFLNESVTKNSFFQVKFNLENGNKILTIWADINVQYAKELLNRCCTNFKTSPGEMHLWLFADHLNFNFTKHAYRFIMNGGEYRFIKELLKTSTPVTQKTDPAKSKRHYPGLFTHHTFPLNPAQAGKSHPVCRKR